MERISNRPKMTIAVALFPAVIVDIVAVCFGAPLQLLAIITVCWLVAVVLLIMLCKFVTYLRERRFSFTSWFIPRPIRKVSAVIPNYNYADYLRGRVDSIISQKYPIYELIILDDKSTDDSIAVIREIMNDLKKRRPELKVRFVPNEENSGNVFKQWEKCFEESAGDYVWICEADDLCNKHFLNAAMRAFNEDDDVVLSYTESCTIDKDGKRLMPNVRVWIDEFKSGHWEDNYINDGKKEISEYLCSNNTIPNVSGVVFKKSEAPYRKYLQEAQKFRLVGDWYFYTKVLLHGKIAYCSESLNYHRMHTGGVTLTMDKYLQYQEVEAVQSSVAKEVKLSSGSKKRMRSYLDVIMDAFGISEMELDYVKVPFAKIISKSKVSDDVLLSVIVSAYNAEEYLDACLTSVEKALPEKSEIIVVDDGSTDKTEDIIKKHKKECIALKSFRKKNGGLSSAKNFGLRKAAGRYVIFMDADDEMRSDGYQVMLKKALEEDADIVVCDMALIHKDGAIENCPVYHKDPGGLKGFLIDGLMASSNNKMVKRELYSKVGKYPEGMNNEDVAITPVLMVLSRNTQYVPSSFYKYYQRDGSIQNSKFSEKRLMIFDTVKLATDAIKKALPEEAEDISGIMVANQLIALLIHVIVNVENNEERNKLFEKFCEKYKKVDVQDSKYIRKYCAEYGLEELPDYLINGSYGEVYDYICKQRKKGIFIDYIGRAFGIKRLMRVR